MSEQLLDELDHWRKRGLFAEEQLAAAQAEIVALQSAFDDRVRVIEMQLEDKRVLSARVRELEAALEKHGRHTHRCNSILAWGEGEHLCDCGLAAALTSATQEPAQPDVRALERAAQEMLGHLSTAWKHALNDQHHCEICERQWARLDRWGKALAAAHEPGAAGEG